MMASGHPLDPPLRALIWRLFGRFAFRWTFHNWYRMRMHILRAFGAEVARDVKFRRTVSIDRPWNLAAGRLALIGDGSTFRCRCPIRVGDHTTISQYTILTTEMLDPASRGEARCESAIIIGADCWVATDSLVLPGVSMADGAVGCGPRNGAPGEAPRIPETQKR